MTLYNPAGRDPDRSAVDSLLRLAADGVFTMPKAVLETAQREQRVRGWAVQVANAEQANVAALTEGLAEALLARAATEDDMPDNLGADVAAAEVEGRRIAALQRAMALAVEKSDRASIAAVRTNAAPIHKALVKAFEQVMDEARRVAPILTGFNLRDRAAFLDRPDNLRQSFRQLEAASDRLQAIVTARRQMRRLTGEPKVDAIGQFDLHRNADAVRVPPKLNAVELLFWLVTGPAEPWLPDVEQQDMAARAARGYEESWDARRIGDTLKAMTADALAGLIIGGVVGLIGGLLVAFVSQRMADRSTDRREARTRGIEAAGQIIERLHEADQAYFSMWRSDSVWPPGPFASQQELESTYMAVRRLAFSLPESMRTYAIRLAAAVFFYRDAADESVDNTSRDPGEAARKVWYRLLQEAERVLGDYIAGGTADPTGLTNLPAIEKLYQIRQKWITDQLEE